MTFGISPTAERIKGHINLGRTLIRAIGIDGIPEEKDVIDTIKKEHPDLPLIDNQVISNQGKFASIFTNKNNAGKTKSSMLLYADQSIDHKKYPPGTTLRVNGTSDTGGGFILIFPRFKGAESHMICCMDVFVKVEAHESFTIEGQAKLSCAMEDEMRKLLSTIVEEESEVAKLLLLPDPMFEASYRMESGGWLLKTSSASVATPMREILKAKTNIQYDDKPVTFGTKTQIQTAVMKRSGQGEDRQAQWAEEANRSIVIFDTVGLQPQNVLDQITEWMKEIHGSELFSAAGVDPEWEDRGCDGCAGSLE
jgi:hypothetical protein